MPCCCQERRGPGAVVLGATQGKEDGCVIRGASGKWLNMGTETLLLKRPLPKGLSHGPRGLLDTSRAKKAGGAW